MAWWWFLGVGTRPSRHLGAGTPVACLPDRSDFRPATPRGAATQSTARPSLSVFLLSLLVTKCCWSMIVPDHRHHHHHHHHPSIQQQHQNSITDTTWWSTFNVPSDNSALAGLSYILFYMCSTNQINGGTKSSYRSSRYVSTRAR